MLLELKAFFLFSLFLQLLCYSLRDKSKFYFIASLFFHTGIVLLEISSFLLIALRLAFNLNYILNIFKLCKTLILLANIKIISNKKICLI